MAIKIGINGFGRIGRLVFRAGLNNPNIEFVGINDPFMTPDYMAYMLRYDTMHGRYEGKIEYTDDAIIVDGKEVKFFACMNPAEIPWGDVERRVYCRVHRRFHHHREGFRPPEGRCQEGCYFRSVLGCARCLLWA